MYSKTKLFLFLFLSLSQFANAQKAVLIEDVTLFDGEKIIKEANVLFEDGFITEVSNEPLTTEGEIINGDGKFLMPALTNSHVHIWGDYLLNAAAKAGVLNTLDMAANEEIMPVLKSVDKTNYATYYAAGYAATAPEGHGTQFGFTVPTLTEVGEAKKFVEDRLNAGADFIKIIVEPRSPTLTHDIVAELIAEAHLQKTITVVHASKMEDAHKVIYNGADGLVHLWTDKVMEDSMIEEWTKNKEFFIIPTLILSNRYMQKAAEAGYEYKRVPVSDLQKQVKKLFDVGVPILVGTDPPNIGINFGSDIFEEMRLISEAGIPNINVLMGATSLPADKFNLAQKGYIRKGYQADMLLIDGNPITNISDISKQSIVWKKGVILD